MPPLNFSDPATAMMPIAPVRATCVPPHAETSKFVDVDQPQHAFALRFLPQRQFRRFLRVSEPNGDRRSSQTMRLASSSARAISPAVTSRARSMVDEVVPRWKLTVRPGSKRSNAADSTCWPVCCCMWSKRRCQSIAPHPTARNLPFDHVQDAAVLVVDDVDDARAAERAGIERLSARCGIESRAVEHDGVTAGVASNRLDRHDAWRRTRRRKGRCSRCGRSWDCALQSADRQYRLRRSPWRAGGSCRIARTARPIRRGS